MRIASPAFMGKNRVRRGESQPIIQRFVWGFVGLLALSQVVLLAVVIVNHLLAPDITRGTMLEGLRRLTRGQPLYPEPSIFYVPLAYNPMLLVVSAVFTPLAGVSPTALRLAAITGTVGAGVTLCLIVLDETRSYFLGLLAVGLFASAYAVFDGFYDQANADSWMLFCGLLGLLIVGKGRNLTAKLMGIAVLSLAFWFKQQGLLLLGAGLLWLTWKEGLVSSWKYWLLATVLVPVAYILLGPRLFGSHFLYYSFDVPTGWSDLNRAAIFRYAKHMIWHWPFATIGALWLLYYEIVRKRRLSIWLFSFPFALGIGFLGVLDSGSENNVFMVSGIWTMMLGVMAVGSLFSSDATGGASPRWDTRRRLSLLPTANVRNLVCGILVIVSFAVNLYNPFAVMVPGSARTAYADLVDYVARLDGQVYMPGVGQLSVDKPLTYTAHWVPLLDMVRGQGESVAHHALIMEILAPVRRPDERVYILANYPLAGDELFGFLVDVDGYVLVEDLGVRYQALKGIPGRFSGVSWPRYLYVSAE